MTPEQVTEISPASLNLKKYIKTPLLFFVTGAAMLASLSDLQLKMVGTIYDQAYATEDWLLIIGLILGIVFTSANTLVYVNHAMKHYDQMEVMPVYQTNIMVWGIFSGMACIDEVRFYSWTQLGLITLASGVCVGGIFFLLQKTKRKEKS